MKTKKRRRYIGLTILLFLILLVSFLLFDSNTRIVTDDYPLYYGNLPFSFDGYRIAQLSDVHSAVFGDENSKLIGAVAASHPNIIVITGDLITYSDTSDDIRLIIKPLVAALVRIAPVYYVTGNHEWGSDCLRELLKTLRQTGVTVLQNDYVRLKIGESSIVLAGVDDPNGPADKIAPEKLISKIRPLGSDPFIILLEHRNIFLKRFSNLGIDLVLCGHAHGGIIRLPFIGGLVGPSRELFPQYTSGVYTENGTNMLVSRGIGNAMGVPRFLNNPEIPVVILRRS
jgi:uncharacterized protein